MVAVAHSSPSKLRRLSRASDPADRQGAAPSDSDTSDCDDPDILAEIAPGPSDRPAPVKRPRAADDSASASRPQKVLCDGVQRSIPAPIVLDSDSDDVTIIDDEPAQKVEHQPTRRAEHQPTQSVNRQPAQRVVQQPTQKVEHQTAQRTEQRTAQKTGHQPGMKTKTDGEGAKTDREGSKTGRLETKTGREGRQTNRVRTYSEQGAAKTTREDAQDAQMKELCRARQALYGFPCPVCDKKSETLTQATLHYHRHDSATALFRCKICDEKFAAWQPNHIRQRHPHIRGPDIFSTIENNFEQGKRNLVRLILEKKKLYSETIMDKVMKITVNLTMVRKQRPVTKPPPETSGALAILASAREKEQEQKRAEELKRKKLAALKALRIGKAIKSESGSKRQPIDVKTSDSNTGTARSSVETPQPSTDAKLQTRPESSSRAASASAVRSDNCDGITTCEQCNFRGISVAVRRHAYWHTDEARRRSENLPHSCHLCFYATEVRTHLQVHLMCVHFVERPGWDSGGGRPGKLPRPDPCNAGPPPEEQARCLRQRRYDCPMCDSFFAERSEFAAHVRRLHIKGRSAPRRSLCPFPHCYHKHDADHIKWYHKTAPLRNRICEDCGGTFYYGKDNQHGNGACVRERSESYECPMPICGFGTRLLANMDRHLVECHSLWVRGTAGPRSAPYFCPVCSAEVSYDEFLNHLGQHDEQVEDVDDPGVLESEDPASVDDTDDAEVKDDPVPVVPVAVKDTARPDRTHIPSTTEAPGRNKVTSRPDRTHKPSTTEVPIGTKDSARPDRTHRPSTTAVPGGTKVTSPPGRTREPNPTEVHEGAKDTARPGRTHRPSTTEVSVGTKDTARPDRTHRPSTTEVLSGRRDTARPDRTQRPSTTEVHSGRRGTARPDRTHRQSTTEVPGGTKVTSRPDRTREPNPTEVPVGAKDTSSKPDMTHTTCPVESPLAAKGTAKPDRPSPMEVSVAAQTRAKDTANQPDSAQTGAVHSTHDSARTGRDTKTERRDERAATAEGRPAAAPPSGGWSQLSVGRFLTERCSQTLQQEAYSQPRGGYQTRGGVDRCFFCPFRADDTRRLELHLAAAHPQQVTAFDMFLKGCVTKLGTKKCPMCNVGFRAKWALFRHVMSHSMNVPKVEGV